MNTNTQTAAPAHDITTTGCSCSDCRCIECRCGTAKACACPRSTRAA